MTSLLGVSLVLCTLAGYSVCQESLEPWRSGILIGQKCERDIECIDNAYCYWQQNCRCDPLYSPSPDNTMCLASAGLGCENSAVCQTMTNGECQQGVCTCKKEYFLDSRNSSNCIRRPVMINDLCQTHDQCYESFNRSFCINERCVCAADHHFVNLTRSCIQNIRLYGTCTYDYDCYEPDIGPLGLLLAMKCKNSQCVCQEGDPCPGKGSLITAAGALLTISLLLQIV